MRLRQRALMCEVVALIGAVCVPSTAVGQTRPGTTAADSAYRANLDRCWLANLPIELIGALRFGAPLEYSANGGVVLLTDCENPERYSGWQITGDLGRRGRGLSIGMYDREEVALTTGVVLTYVETTRESWLSAANAHYAGPELRISAFLIGLNIGLLHRVDRWGPHPWAVMLVGSGEGWICCSSHKR